MPNYNYRPPFLSTSGDQNYQTRRPARLAEHIQPISPDDSDRELDRKLTVLLHELGIPSSLTGYDFVKTALRLVMADHSLIHSMTTRLYPAVANEFSTTPSRAERAIRHAIETGWSRANTDLIYKVFGYSISANTDRPPNKEFLATVAEYILQI